MTTNTQSAKSYFINVIRPKLKILPTLPLALWVVFFIAVPLIFTVAYSFQTYGYYVVDLPWTLENYRGLFDTTAYYEMFLKTVIVSFIISIVGMIIATPMAYYLSRIASKRLGVALLLIMVIPLWMNIVVRNYAWISMTIKGGVLDQLHQAVGLNYGDWLFHIELVTAVGILLFVPISLLVLYGSMGSISQEIEEASMDLGNSRIKTFFKTIFPLSASSYQTAFLLTFMPSLAMYVTPKLLGGVDGMLLASVLMPVVKSSLNFAKGGAIVIPIMVLLLVVTFLLRRGINIENVYRAGVGSNIARGTNRKNPWLFIYCIIIIVVSYIPVFSLVFFSFDANPLAMLPLMGPSWVWYQDMLNSTGLLNALKATVLVGLETAAIAVVISAPAAYAVTRFKFMGRGLIVFMSLLPMLIPEFITGMAIMLMLNFFDARLSLHTIAVGHVTLAIPFVFLTILAQQYGFDRHIEEASQDLGSSPLGGFFKVTLPQMMPALIAAGFLAITVSFNDYVVSFLLTGTDTTFPVFIFGLLKSGVSPTVNAAGSLLLAAVVGLLIIGLLRPWKYLDKLPKKYRVSSFISERM